jgi:hypothetical protein
VAGILTKIRVKTFRKGLLVFSPQRIIFPFVTKNMKMLFYEFDFALQITGRTLAECVREEDISD